MTHNEIEQRDIIDEYVRNRLQQDVRQLFEEHYFGCDQCFQKVQMAQNFAEGVSHAARTGLLPQVTERPTGWFFGNWLQPAFAFSAVAAALLAVATGWYALVEIPRLKMESQAASSKLKAAEEKAIAYQEQLSEKQLALTRPPEAMLNLPLVMLEASRAGTASQIVIPANASHAAIWIELPPGAGFASYSLAIGTTGGTTIENLNGLKKNAYGALAVAIPAAKLVPGTYKAVLSGDSGSQHPLVGEYRMVVKR